MNGGKRTPARGFYLRRDDPRPTHVDFIPAAAAFMAQDSIERKLGHDDDAYRVRRMLDSRDLWTVVPERDMHASTAFEREYFDDIGSISTASKQHYRIALSARRRQTGLIRSRMRPETRRIMGRD